MRVHRLQVRNIEDLLLATGGNREFRPVQMGPRNVTGELAMTTVDGLTLTYGNFRSDIHVSGTMSNDRLSLGVLLAAEGIGSFGKHARPGDLVVVGDINSGLWLARGCLAGRRLAQLDMAIH